MHVTKIKARPNVDNHLCIGLTFSEKSPGILFDLEVLLSKGGALNS